MGLIRVITGVLPLAAIVCLKAYDYLEKKYFEKGDVPVRFSIRDRPLPDQGKFFNKQIPCNVFPPRKSYKIRHRMDQTFTFRQKEDPFYSLLCSLSSWFGPVRSKTMRTSLFTELAEQLSGWNCIHMDSYFGTNECNVPLTLLKNQEFSGW